MKVLSLENLLKLKQARPKPNPYNLLKHGGRFHHPYDILPFMDEQIIIMYKYLIDFPLL